MKKNATRSSDAPIFSQITDHFRAEIDIGKLKAHDALPSERHIADQYDVSRMTARRALEAIENEGLVYSLERKGRFVSPRRLTYDVNSMRSFVADAKAQGFHPDIKLMENIEIQPDEVIVKLLQIDSVTPVQKSMRAISMDHHVTFLETEYVVIERCKRFLKSGVLPTQRYSPFGESADITIRMRPISPLEAGFFSMVGNQSGLEQEQIIRDKHGRPFCLCRQMWRGERAQFSAKAIL